MTTPINYLYIDDEQTNIIEPLMSQIINGADKSIAITHKQVFENISEVLNFLKENDFDGLIIDQQLNAVSQEGYKADYFGSTLAQQLRTEMAVGNIKYFPLILLSNERVIVESYAPDDSAKNLFDFVIIKNELTNPQKCARANKVLYSLFNAYNIARSIKKENGQDLSKDELLELLSCTNDIYEGLDTRFLDYVSSKACDPHSLVGSIYSSLIQSAGILVTEQMLLTKLGISSSSADWPLIKDLLNEYLYQGPFKDLKERWWLQGIENWWFEIYPNQVLQSLSCEERVNIISKNLNFDKIVHIENSYPEGDQSPNHWINCIISGVSLDPFDALRVRDSDAKPWEQPKYVDLRSFLNDHTNPPKYVLHLDDKDKVKKLIARLKPNVNE